MPQPVNHNIPAKKIELPRENTSRGRAFRLLGFALVCSFILSFEIPAGAQKLVDYSIHANILFHFTKYINWPPHKKSGDFVIGVLGESSIIEALQNSVANKKVGNQEIVIKQLSTAAAAGSCHIVFLADAESYQISKLAERTVGTNTLVVTEAGGLSRKGACISFLIENDRLKLEISRKNIDKRKLAIATELLQLGRVTD